MTPHFITPCYVRVEDADKFKKVYCQLEQIGYGLGQAYADALDTVIVTYPMVANTFCTGSNGQFDETDLKGCIDCGTNTALFLALAGMRSDTDEGQWYVFLSTGKLERYTRTAPWPVPEAYGLRKATAAEIIEHFNNK